MSITSWIFWIIAGLLIFAGPPLLLAWAGHAIATAVETALDALGERLTVEPAPGEEGDARA